MQIAVDQSHRHKLERKYSFYFIYFLPTNEKTWLQAFLGALSTDCHYLKSRSENPGQGDS